MCIFQCAAQNVESSSSVGIKSLVLQPMWIATTDMLLNFIRKFPSFRRKFTFRTAHKSSTQFCLMRRCFHGFVSILFLFLFGRFFCSVRYHLFSFGRFRICARCAFPTILYIYVMHVIEYIYINGIV